MPKDSDFEKLSTKEQPSHKDEKIEQLEAENTGLKDQLLEDRFYFLLVAVILVDMVLFVHMPPSWGGPIAIVFLQSIGLIAVARKCRVDVVVEITGRILDGWDGQSKKDKTK